VVSCAETLSSDSTERNSVDVSRSLKYLFLCMNFQFAAKVSEHSLAHGNICHALNLPAIS
ncbi:MAG: hypothetical protein NTZ19_07360, partial [Bacteroidetes bacterium]|nr:hypothetical protein [Bacteroidota bacterium]